jgi:hypothetical protein
MTRNKLKSMREWEERQQILLSKVRYLEKDTGTISLQFSV